MARSTAVELRDALRSGRLSARDLASATLSAIADSEAGGPGLNAFISRAKDAAILEAAAEIDRRRENGEAIGPLAGLPVAVKDNICTSDLPTTCGSRMLQGYRSPYEATVVRRLRAAGALIIGKTNMDEFAMGSSTENSAYGPTRNPHDPDRVPGGSSGGSAAAVAAGLVPLALGSDTGGSVRQPAAFCGTVGIRPSYGRVSRYGLVAFASSLDQVGVFGATVRDAAELLEVIAGSDRRDATCARRSAPRLAAIDREAAETLRGLRVGVPRDYYPDDLEPAISDACRAALDRLDDAGAQIHEIRLPHTEHALAAYYLIATAEASSNLARYDGVRFGYRDPDARSAADVYERSRGGGFGREVKRRILLGTYVLSAGYHEEYYARAVAVRRQVADEFRKAFESVDVMLTPTTPTRAFRLRERVDRPTEMYGTDAFTAPPSLAGLPAASIPIGDSPGLPIGAQVIVPRFEDARLVSAAHALQEVAGTADAPGKAST